VLVVDTSGHRLLLLGDVEPEAQAALAADLIGQRYDVVKIPHHGSQYQDPNLPVWAPAPIALISVGLGNDYGHPSDDTIRAWRSIGALVARTDVSGDVAVVTSGSGLDVVARHGMLPSS
jgi:competence protein ComEC